MFERGFVPVYLTFCALALALWTALAPDSRPAPTLGWALTGMVALYAVALLLVRATRVPGLGRTFPAGKTEVNADRVAGRPGFGDIDDPRR